ncbi:unnamed protein product [Lymnaea stagnalis]|uniref:Peptidase metallopeptidase domain-containing protein n=1 Tax=Lymnaea stagnalis TaxID=6523 RepID=A0AAV2I347_LYMST
MTVQRGDTLPIHRGPLGRPPVNGCEQEVSTASRARNCSRTLTPYNSRPDTATRDLRKRSRQQGSPDTSRPASDAKARGAGKDRSPKRPRQSTAREEGSTDDMYGFDTEISRTRLGEVETCDRRRIPASRCGHEPLVDTTLPVASPLDSSPLASSPLYQTCIRTRGCKDTHTRDDGVPSCTDDDGQLCEDSVSFAGSPHQGERGRSGASGHGCKLLTRCVRALVLSLCILACVGYPQGRNKDLDKHYKQVQQNTVKYLAQFGYLKGASRETQNLMSQHDLRKAIKALQKAGGIPLTGLTDSRTEELMSKPRCGNMDDFVDDPRGDGEYEGSGFKSRKKRYTTGTSKWPRTNLTFRFVNYTPDMETEITRGLISDALRVWSDATPLSFTEVRDSAADIMIMFASQYHSDGYPFDGKGMVLGHAFFPGNGKGGDTHFDDDENWTANSTDGVDLFMVAAHEFGHALGLAHSGDPSALMYPWYMGFDGKFKLPEDDLRGIISLYGEQNRHLPDKAGVNMIPKSDRATSVPPTDPPKKDKEYILTNPPDPCKSHIDAITVIRTELFLFIGKWFWRMDSRRHIPAPVDIHQFWYGLPKDLLKIDAVFERPDSKIVFFSDDRYWVFNANTPIQSFPPQGRSITEFNIPPDVKKIDAAFVWGYNMRTYLVSGDMYWKMNENNTFVEYDYPRDMRTWKGVPVPLDAAFKDLSGTTIFFQGQDYYEFYDMKMQVKRGYPKSFAKHWLHCPEPQMVEQKSQVTAAAAAQEEEDTETPRNVGPLETFYGALIMVLLLCYRLLT